MLSFHRQEPAEDLKTSNPGDNWAWKAVGQHGESNCMAATPSPELMATSKSMPCAKVITRIRSMSNPVPLRLYSPSVHL